MENNKVIDTADLLKKSEEDLLFQIERIKKNITFFIKPEVLVNEISEIIEQSELFSFKNKRNSKFINLSRPLFIITINKAKCKELYGYEFHYTEGTMIDTNKALPAGILDDYNFIERMVGEQIVSKYSDFLNSILVDDDKFLNFLEEQGIKRSKINKELVKLISYMTVALFAITIELRNNIIYLEYGL